MEMIKCTCNDGTAKVLETLRATSAETISQDDWNDVVKAVNVAGGINKNLRGFARVTLAKAVTDYNEGVLKGDYVGHPFRGNQHASSSGATRGGASASGGVNRTNLGGAGRRASGRYTASEQALGALNDQLAGKKDRFAELEAEAEAVVASKIRDDASDTIMSINDLIDGVKNVREASRSAIAQIEKRKAEAEYFTGDDDKTNPDSPDYENEIRAEDRVIKQSAKVDALLSKVYGAINYATNSARKDENDLGMVRSRYRELPALANQLQSMRSEVRDAVDAERAASRIGMSTRGAGARMSLLQTAIKSAIDNVENLYNDVEFAGSNALELANEMAQDQ